METNQFSNLKHFVVISFLMMLLPAGMIAQTSTYNVLDIKKIAAMLIAEKASGNIDDTPFIAYWDSLGFKKNRQIGINNYEYKHSDKSITVLIITNDNERRFELSTENSSFCWYHFIRLKEFGLKGPNSVARGKGLTAVAGRNRLWISYDLPKKAKGEK